MKLLATLSILFLLLQPFLYAKTIYDATLYLHKNALNNSIFPSITVLYEDMLLPKGTDTIDIDYLKKYARSLPRSSAPYILDIEAWNIRPDVFDFIANSRIDKYITVIKTLKHARPDLKFGYYGLLPVRDYVTAHPSKRQLKKWHEANIRVKRLAKYVDVICPDLYTFFYKDKKYWERYATKAIADARMYNKPILPFIWPEYHDTDKKHIGTFIDPAFWKFQLDFLGKKADGIIIWGGRDLSVTPHTSRRWDDKAPWWKLTKEAIRKKK